MDLLAEPKDLLYGRGYRRFCRAGRPLFGIRGGSGPHLGGRRVHDGLHGIRIAAVIGGHRRADRPANRIKVPRFDRFGQIVFQRYQSLQQDVMQDVFLIFIISVKRPSAVRRCLGNVIDRSLRESLRAEQFLCRGQDLRAMQGCHRFFFVFSSHAFSFFRDPVGSSFYIFTTILFSILSVY